MRKLVEYFAERSLIVNIISFALLASGLMFIFTAQREAADILNWLRDQCKTVSEDFDKLEFNTVRQGPPVGKAISVAVKGSDFIVLQKIAGEFEKYLSGIKGLKDVKNDFEERKDEIKVFVDEKTAAVTGITVFDVATTVRSCYEGTAATKIKKTDEEIDIRYLSLRCRNYKLRR